MRCLFCNVPENKMKKTLPVISTVVVLLLSPIFTSAQSRIRSAPAKRATSHATKLGAPVENVVFGSPSGKVSVAGMHSGSVGILKIHVDSSLKGSIAIAVTNNGRAVKQGKERADII